MSKFKTEVIADNSGKWAGNLLEFDSFDEAKAYVKDLAWRWTSVRKARVVEFEVLSVKEDGTTDGSEILKETVVFGE